MYSRLFVSKTQSEQLAFSISRINSSKLGGAKGDGKGIQIRQASFFVAQEKHC